MRIRIIQKIIDKFRLKSKYSSVFFGNFRTFEDAVKYCNKKQGGCYEKPIILDRLLENATKLKNSTRKKIQKPTILSCIQKAALENNNKLNILDFGGSLGESYIRIKDIIKPIKIENYTVVEQPHFVKAGNEKLADNILNFKNTIDEVGNIDCLILSGVLQCLPEPHNWIDKFLSKKYKFIVIDRIPFLNEGNDRLTVQKYKNVNYPAWFFNEDKFMSQFEKYYDIVFEWIDYNDSVKEIPSLYKGVFLRIKN